MGYILNKDQQDLVDLAKDFAQKKVAPFVAELDRAEVPGEKLYEIYKEAVDIGFCGLEIPEEYGGMGLDYIDYAIAVEELARVDGGAGVILSAHVSLGSYPIFAYGTEEQKKKYLTPLASGKKLAAFGLTEPNAGSDAGETEPPAVFDGQNWILNGNKIFITNAGKADTYVVFAVTEPGKGTKGISAFPLCSPPWPGSCPAQ